ncbi:MAG TPA: sulfite exporter TauE/SafE family protein [Hydrogenophaga sp.]|uniref:sulfite exporter TauE/SafE family protein n=1 Tax=Hydrogenophaga sp. TaxID=1904254 RepID=UPI002C957623|nr:sulfite exporter TauE/SafE family protein [Hydrogenophaga sp.]HMN94402.1 sulfite exporter TauE/SafE family protein [Hydrogenophaga sp.]HMP11414.1 sulfite exporter TauE/SafE family protein [Hydrogenophaga sp.]
MPLLCTALAVSLGAGFVRGFAGFGYSALVVLGLSLLVSPATVVPAVLMLEVIASAGLLRGSWPHVDRSWLRALSLGTLMVTPLGMVCLAWLPEGVARLGVGCTVLLCACFLRAAGHRSPSDSAALRAVAGVGAGWLNGLASSGGVWAALWMTGAGVPAAAMRATMDVFLFSGGVYALLWAAALSLGQDSDRLLSSATLGWVGLLLPTMWLGMVWGRRCVAAVNPGRLRHLVLNLLIAMASVGVLRALLGLQKL